MLPSVHVPLLVEVHRRGVLRRLVLHEAGDKDVLHGARLFLGLERLVEDQGVELQRVQHDGPDRGHRHGDSAALGGEEHRVLRGVAFRRAGSDQLRGYVEAAVALDHRLGRNLVEALRCLYFQRHLKLPRPLRPRLDLPRPLGDDGPHRRHCVRRLPAYDGLATGRPALGKAHHLSRQVVLHDGLRPVATRHLRGHAPDPAPRPARRCAGAVRVLGRQPFRLRRFLLVQLPLAGDILLEAVNGAGARLGGN
mmetsp:Transcript_65634/g.190225  ORF Transcript_65634/g.190225 Transcript_65634/m.190225 type:complete len:251 (-) Transcript_65634:244-996(-)